MKSKYLFIEDQVIDLNANKNSNNMETTTLTKHSVNTIWVNKLSFDSTIDNHIIRLDTNGKLGDDSGPSPKKLLLASLAGCTGMDVTSLLEKMRVPIAGLEIKIEAELTDTHPKVYSKIKIIYHVKGKNLDEKKVAKAVALSQEKYCGVSAMLKESSAIDYSILYEHAKN